jgi:hypothetical protein
MPEYTAIMKAQFLEWLSPQSSNFIAWTKEWPTKKVFRIRHELSDDSLCARYFSDEMWVGSSFGPRTYYLILDIDKHSQYRTSQEIKRIIELFTRNNIFFTPYRSSSISNGVHLLATFSEPVSVKKLAPLVDYLLRNNEYVLQAGQLEQYPSMQSSGHAVRLPFQQGFTKLDDDLYPIDDSDDLTDRWKALRYAFQADCSDSSKIPFYKTPPRYVQTTRRAYKTIRCPKLELFSASRYERFKIGESLYFSGLLDHGTRHNALLFVGFYLYFTIPFGAEHRNRRLQALKEWMRDKNNGLSKTWRMNPDEVYQAIVNMVDWHPKSLKSELINHCFTKVNFERMARSKHAIDEVLLPLIASGALWKKNKEINLSSVIKATGLNNRTVYNYRPYIEEQIAVYTAFNDTAKSPL